MLQSQSLLYSVLSPDYVLHVVAQLGFDDAMRRISVPPLSGETLTDIPLPHGFPPQLPLFTLRYVTP